MVALIAVLAMAAGPEGRAHAEEPPTADRRAAARARLVDGDRLLKSGEFQQALKAFNDAFELFPSPKIHYNFALAHQGMGRNADALEAFDTFLREATDAPEETRTRARAAREALLQRVGMLRLTVDVPGAPVVVDGREVGRTPLGRDVPLDPGPHLLLVDRPGGGAAPCTQRLTVTAGASVTAECRLLSPAVGGAPPPVHPDPPAPAAVAARADTASPAAGDAPTVPDAADPHASVNGDAGRTWRLAGMAVGGAGVLLVGGGLLFGWQAHAAAEDVSRQYDAERERVGQRAEKLQWVGYGLGAAGLVTGALLYLRGTRADEAEDPTAVHALITPRGLLVEGRF